MTTETPASARVRYFFMDKSTWGPGPWQDEPDKVVWVDERTDLDCMVHRGPITGSLCGYVGVLPGHPWWGVDYSSIGADVHGGLTYAAPCQIAEDEGRGICHVPKPGRPGDVYWLGFDTGHGMDINPRMDALLREVMPDLASFSDNASYKTLAYVTREIEGLATQAATASSS